MGPGAYKIGGIIVVSATGSIITGPGKGPAELEKLHRNTLCVRASFGPLREQVLN